MRNRKCPDEISVYYNSQNPGFIITQYVLLVTIGGDYWKSPQKWQKINMHKLALTTHCNAYIKVIAILLRGVKRGLCGAGGLGWFGFCLICISYP